MKKIKAFQLENFNSRVFYNSEYNEFIVKFYRDGVYLPAQDYFTDNLEDAIGTAQIALNNLIK